MLEAPHAHTPTTTQPFTNDQEKREEVRSQANRLYDQEPDWVTFYREVLGVNGLVRRNYPDAQALTDFEKTDEYCEIQQMIAKLRQHDGRQ